jgi:hypothetical protein
MDVLSWETSSGTCTVPLTTAAPPSNTSKFPVPFCTMITNSMDPGGKKKIEIKTATSKNVEFT